MMETQFTCTRCGASVVTYRWVSYRTIPPSVDVRDLCEVCKEIGEMRELTSHVVHPANDRLRITVEDAPGAGGAHHLYTIRGYDSTGNLSYPSVLRYGKSSNQTTILFQNGPIAEVGINGITHEALLAILIDRLRCFQEGPFPSSDNEDALGHLQAALQCLKRRTLERMTRGVEGQMRA